MTDLLSLPNAGRYGCVLADPPWSFRTYSRPSGQVPQRAVQAHYKPMSRAELVALPVGAITGKDCALLMWTVSSHIDQALDLGRAWGFGFKTLGPVWDKGHMGMGYWFRQQTEICLMFTKGKPKRLSGGVRQLIKAPRREHSRKPDEQYERIERLVAGPYLEMFARQSRPNWDSWGNEVGKFDQEAA